MDGEPTRTADPATDAVRGWLVVAALVVLLLVAGAAAGETGSPDAASASTPRPAPVRYELALGDSLAVGVGADSPAAGYVADLYRQVRSRLHGLRLVDLGCSGATTTSFLEGGGCDYPAGTQMAAARSFLRSHRGQVAFVTLDLGINDIDGCLTLVSVDDGCVSAGLRRASSDLAAVLAGLRAADPSVVVVGGDYYDPYLAAWKAGPTGRPIAQESEAVVLALDEVLAQVYAAAGARLAQVAGQFRTLEISSSATGSVPPAAVARVCAWTWMCAAGDLHPDDAGYRQIAVAFERALIGTAVSGRS